jgi:hypothetical protein
MTFSMRFQDIESSKVLNVDMEFSCGPKKSSNRVTNRGKIASVLPLQNHYSMAVGSRTIPGVQSAREATYRQFAMFVDANSSSGGTHGFDINTIAMPDGRFYCQFTKPFVQFLPG